VGMNSPAARNHREPEEQGWREVMKDETALVGGGGIGNGLMVMTPPPPPPPSPEDPTGGFCGNVPVRPRY
jgi:hypothetical protein